MHVTKTSDPNILAHLDGLLRHEGLIVPNNNGTVLRRSGVLDVLLIRLLLLWGHLIKTLGLDELDTSNHLGVTESLLLLAFGGGNGSWIWLFGRDVFKQLLFHKC